MDMCGDNRFEIIEAAKKHLIDATNIETSPDEMAVLDNILFRMWQMDWLPIHAHWIEEDDGWGNTYWTCSNCREPWWLEEGTPENNNMFYCPHCGAIMDEEVEDDNTCL